MARRGRDCEDEENRPPKKRKSGKQIQTSSQKEQAPKPKHEFQLTLITVKPKLPSKVNDLLRGIYALLLYRQRFTLHHQLVYLYCTHMSFGGIYVMPKKLRNSTDTYTHATPLHSYLYSHGKAVLEDGYEEAKLRFLLRRLHALERFLTELVYQMKATRWAELEKMSSVIFQRLQAAFAEELYEIVNCVLRREWKAVGRLLGNHAMFRFSYRCDRQVKTYAPLGRVNKTRMPIFGSPNQKSFAFPFLYAFHRLAMMRMMRMDVHSEGKAVMTLAILNTITTRTQLQKCRYYVHSMLADALMFIIFLDHLDFAADIRLCEEVIYKRHNYPEYTNVYNGYRFLVLFIMWMRGDRSGDSVPHELSNLGMELGLPGWFFVEAAIRAWNVVDHCEDDMVEAATKFCAVHPHCIGRAARLLRECDLAEDSESLMQQLRPGSVHPAERVWADWAERQMRKPKKRTHEEVARAMFAYLDYGSNRGDAVAWRMLLLAMEECPMAVIEECWEERRDWWPVFHKEPEAVPYREDALFELGRL